MAEREEITFRAELERIAGSDPFEAFTVTMASGQSYRVEGDDTLAFGRNVVILFNFRNGYTVLRQSQISEVSVPGGGS